ncbi:hypothetical protein ACJX0J_042405, partial [Zea mays]
GCRSSSGLSLETLREKPPRFLQKCASSLTPSAHGSVASRSLEMAGEEERKRVLLSHAVPTVSSRNTTTSSTIGSGSRMGHRRRISVWASSAEEEDCRPNRVYLWFVVVFTSRVYTTILQDLGTDFLINGQMAKREATVVDRTRSPWRNHLSDGEGKRMDPVCPRKPEKGPGTVKKKVLMFSHVISICKSTLQELLQLYKETDIYQECLMKALVSCGHSEAVICCMETIIMRLVIEESEDVQPQIASCLLQNVRKEEK